MSRHRAAGPPTRWAPSRPAARPALLVVLAACTAALATTVVGSAATLPVDGGVVQVFVLEHPGPGGDDAPAATPEPETP